MAKSRPGQSPTLFPPGVVVLDSGGVTAAATDRSVLVFLKTLLKAGWAGIVPAPVLVESLPSDERDAHVNRLLQDAPVRSCDEAIARTAARLRRKALQIATPSAVDAIVAAHAVASIPQAIILTGDRADLKALTQDNPHVFLRAV